MLLWLLLVESLQCLSGGTDVLTERHLQKKRANALCLNTHKGWENPVQESKTVTYSSVSHAPMLSTHAGVDNAWTGSVQPLQLFTGYW